MSCDYVTRASSNQGIVQTAGLIEDIQPNPANCWSLGLIQMDFFWRKRPWYASQYMRMIKLNRQITPNAHMFLTAALNKLKEDLVNVLVRNVESKFLSSTICLPLAPDGNPDFYFMNKFISDLRVKELSLINRYLDDEGLSNPVLTEKEREALLILKTVTWEDFKMEDIFEKVKTNKLPFKAKDLPKEPTGSFVLPCLTSSFLNQGLNYYSPVEESTVLCNVISIPSNSDVYRSYYQSRNFTVLSDAYAIKTKEEGITGNAQLFAVAAINKFTNVDLYSHKQKLGGWNKVKEMKVKLPVDTDRCVDWNLMDNVVSALKKQQILSVVECVQDELS